MKILNEFFLGNQLSRYSQTFFFAYDRKISGPWPFGFSFLISTYVQTFSVFG